MKHTQVDDYDDPKRPYTDVHDDENGRNRHTYDRIRAVNETFHMRRITVVQRRVVYGEKRPRSMITTIINDRILTFTMT